MPGNCVFSNDLLRRELRSMPKSFDTVQAAKTFLTQKLGAYYTISITRDGKWGKFRASLQHKRKEISLGGFSDDLHGLVRRLLISA